MVPDRDDLEIIGLFGPDRDIPALMHLMRAGGVGDEKITILSPLPLPHTFSLPNSGMFPYGLAIGAGIIGIGVGVLFAAGTAAIYPLMTGGKPIVSFPIVGIISFETMMLLAIVATFVTMIATIKRAQRDILRRDIRVDEGIVAFYVRLPHDDVRISLVRDLLERSGARDISISSPRPSSPLVKGRVGPALMALMLCSIAISGCSRDMEDQPSYRTQESPRLHSPRGSIPRRSRAVIPRNQSDGRHMMSSGKELYRINCLHCHGAGGRGTGPIAGLLREPPADLLSAEMRQQSVDDLYATITGGKDMMPSFRGELSAEERYAVAAYVKTLSQ